MPVAVNTESDKKIKIEDSNEAEFSQGISGDLSACFKEGVSEADTLPKEPVVIITQKEKLVFDDINPSIQKGYYDEDEVIYENLGYCTKINKHLLFAQYYEGEAYFLIDHATAKKDTINGMPDFSPNAKRMVCYYVSPYNEGESLLSAEMEFYNLTKKGLKPLHKQTYDFIPYDIKWKGNDAVLVKALSAEEFYQSQSDTVNKKKPQHFFYKKIILK